MALSDLAIFDPDRVRSDPDQSDHDERTFDFYDRCSNKVIGLVRDRLEFWFARYPEGRDRNDLLGRFRSGDRRHWNSAFWELYVHEALRRFGFDVVPHPALNDVPTHIDFLATRGMERVFVECVTLGHADDDVARRNGVAALQAALDKSGLHDYWLDLEIDSYGPTPIPHGRFRRALVAWVGAQDIDVLAALVPRGLFAIPAFEWHRNGWRIQVRAIPREPSLRGRTDMRPLGIMPADDEGDTPTWAAMRDLLRDKASKYGKLDAPFLIALDAPDVWPNHREATWAVYGPRPFTEAWERDGFLLRQDGRSYPRVSGVLVGTAIQPHSFPRCWPTLHENPAAERRLPQALRWTRIRAGREESVDVPGIDPPELFGVAPDWPGTPWP